MPSSAKAITVSESKRASLERAFAHWTFASGGINFYTARHYSSICLALPPAEGVWLIWKVQAGVCGDCPSRGGVRTHLGVALQVLGLVYVMWLCSFGIVSNSTWNQRISREKPTNVAKCDELVGLFRRNYDENSGEKRKLPTKFMIYARIVGFLTDKRCLIL